MQNSSGQRQILAGLLAGALTATLWAGGKGGAAAGQAGRERCEHLAQELELTTEQTGILQRHLQEKRAKFTELYQARSSLKAELDKLFAAAEPDEQAIAAAGNRLGGINAEITRQQVQARLAVRSMLTPDQQERWRRMRQRMLQRQAGKTRAARQGPNSGGVHPVDQTNRSDWTDRAD